MCQLNQKREREMEDEKIERRIKTERGESELKEKDSCQVYGHFEFPFQHTQRHHIKMK